MGSEYQYDKEGRPIWKMPPPTGTPEERGRAWDAAIAAAGKVMLPSTGGKFAPATPKTMDASTIAFLEEEARAAKIKTANRIAKMKGKLHKRKIDPVHHVWETHRFRPCWVWADTREPVMFNPDGSAQPRGAKPQPPTSGTTKEGNAMKASSKPAKAGKAPAKAAKSAPKAKATSTAKPKAKAEGTRIIKPAPAVDAALTASVEKAKAKGSRTSGVITAIVAYISRPEGATVDEIMAYAESTFPGYKANRTTCRVYPSKAATHRERIEGRGIVYYNRGNEQQAAA